MVATGASGTNAVRYGVMKENILNLEVVLADGTVLYTRGKDARPRKSAAGLNLTDLFVGSEGILGIITMATLRLHARPSFTSSAVCSFPTLLDTVNSVVETLQSGIPVARIEFMDEVQVLACNVYSNLTLDERPTLFLEFHGSNKRDVEEQARSVGNICSSNGGSCFVWSTLPHEIDKLWTARHNAYYAALSLRKGARGFTTDVCVPISRLAQVIVETRMDLTHNGLIGTIVGHVGDGNFHVILPINEEDEEEKSRVWKFSDRLIKRALLANGTCTGEHGIGIGKIPYLEQEMGPIGMSVMNSIKNALDPYGILNPGKVLM